jgi:hypothetical protein
MADFSRLIEKINLRNPHHLRNPGFELIAEINQCNPHRQRNSGSGSGSDYESRILQTPARR